MNNQYQVDCNNCNENLEGYTGGYCPVCDAPLDLAEETANSIVDSYYHEPEIEQRELTDEASLAWLDEEKSLDYAESLIEYTFGPLKDIN